MTSDGACFKTSQSPKAPEREVLRQCVACRKMFSRSILVRIVYDRKQQKVFLIPPSLPTSISSGRSVYLCASQECLKMALKGKKIQKALKTLVSDDILNCLNDLLKDQNNHGST